MTSLIFSVNIETLSSTPHEFYLKATPDERMEIAKRLNLLSIVQLRARLYLQKEGRLILSGHIFADVTQECVRTLVPLAQHLKIKVEEFFFFAPPEDNEKKEIDLNILEKGEPLQGPVLELGEIVIQLLSLNLDPYPITPDSKPIEYHDKNGSSSPFEVLKKKK